MQNYRTYLFIFLKGVAMGAADIVPGISGGTVAFVTGIYERLLTAIYKFDSEALRLLGNKQWKACWQYIDGTFLFFLGIGIGTSLLTLSRAVLYLLKQYPIPLYAFFIGVMLASIGIVFDKLKKKSWGSGGVVIIMAIGMYFLMQSVPLHTPSSNWFIFLLGILAMSAMLLPGISGSALLLLLGKYQIMLIALKELHWGRLFSFSIGALVGIFTLGRGLTYLLRNYHDITLASLIGLMIGSLPKLWPWKWIIDQGFNEEGALPLMGNNVTPQQFVKFSGTEALIGQALLGVIVGFFVIQLAEYWLKCLQKPS